MKTTVAVCAAIAMLAAACDHAPASGLLAKSARDAATRASMAAPSAITAGSGPAAEGSGSTSDEEADADSIPSSDRSIMPAMLIRTAQASVEVGVLDTGITAVRTLAQRVGGYVADVSVQDGRDQPRTATLEVRVPAVRFDDALAGLRPLGKVESVSVTTADVGEEYVDVNARMDNARKLESRLIALLATRTGKLADVLAVERELSRVREGIERYEGRLRYLRTRAAVSTISVTVHEPLPVVGERGSGNALAEAFRQAWRNFVRFLAGGIAAMGVVLPLGLIGAIAWRLAHRLGVRPRPPETPAHV